MMLKAQLKTTQISNYNIYVKNNHIKSLTFPNTTFTYKCIGKQSVFERERKREAKLKGEN